ncbi:hypothetical protein G7046_g590 [Stylonectria norvegica]|nr:hypothetical protein G7046_g590 [Stylonectria norvegica]
MSSATSRSTPEKFQGYASKRRSLGLTPSSTSSLINFGSDRFEDKRIVWSTVIEVTDLSFTTDDATGSIVPARNHAPPPPGMPSKDAATAKATKPLSTKKIRRFTVQPNNHVLLKICSAAGEVWMSEFDAQVHHYQSLYRFWESRGGRDRATRLRTYHVFRVVDGRSVEGDKWEFEVQWVGYPRRHSTWETETRLVEEFGAKGYIDEWLRS